MDLCYGLIKRAYKSFGKPPLGSSDHNTVSLVPTYKNVLKRDKAQLINMKNWSEDVMLRLKWCMDSTDLNWILEFPKSKITQDSYVKKK